MRCVLPFYLLATGSLFPVVSFTLGAGGGKPSAFFQVGNILTDAVTYYTAEAIGLGCRACSGSATFSALFQRVAYKYGLCQRKRFYRCERRRERLIKGRVERGL